MFYLTVTTKSIFQYFILIVFVVSFMFYYLQSQLHFKGLLKFRFCLCPIDKDISLVRDFVKDI